MTPAIHRPSSGTGCRNSTASVAGSSGSVVQVTMKLESAPQETMRGWLVEMKAADGLADPCTATKCRLCRGGSASMKASTVAIPCSVTKAMTLSSVIVSGRVAGSWSPWLPTPTETQMTRSTTSGGNVEAAPRRLRTPLHFPA